jgi:hypothetical protein
MGEEQKLEIHGFQDIEKSIEITRQEYHKTTTPIKHILESPINLLIESLRLIGNVAKLNDEEHYILEILIVAFRRLIASIISLESGLPQEAHMVLRNTLEWKLIAIDITYNKNSMVEWIKTSQANEIDNNDWYFTPRKIWLRIEVDKENMIYPKLENSLAENIYKEWKLISNKSLHAHSHLQIKQLFTSDGTFQFLGRKTVDNYEINFRTYKAIIFNIVSLLVGIPKYRELIGKTETLKIQRDNFAIHYAKIRDESVASGGKGAA